MVHLRMLEVNSVFGVVLLGVPQQQRHGEVVHVEDLKVRRGRVALAWNQLAPPPGMPRRGRAVDDISPSRPAAIGPLQPDRVVVLA